MRSRRNNSTLWGSLGISLLLHVNVVLLAVAVLSANPDGCALYESEMDPFEVSLVPDESKELEAAKKKLEEIKKEEEKKKKDDPRGQVVDLPPPDEEERPDKARFLSDYDSKVKKETKGPQVPFKPGRLIPKRPIHVPRQPPPTRQQRQQLRRKMMKLAMRPRVKVDIPKSELPDSKGDEPAQVKKPQKKVPRGRSKKAAAKGAKKKTVSLKQLKLSKQFCCCSCAK